MTDSTGEKCPLPGSDIYKGNEYVIEWTFHSIQMRFFTDSALFSPRKIDTGTVCMLSAISLKHGEKVCDLGCGYGVVGIYAAHLVGADFVTMIDINPTVVFMARKNAAYNQAAAVRVIQSDGFSRIGDETFDYILSNPPYHTDFSVAKHFIEEGYRHLSVGGHMVMVTKREKWYRNKLKTRFGKAEVRELNGYFIFIAEKREPKRGPREGGRSGKNGMSRKLARRYRRKEQRGFKNNLQQQ